MNADLTASRPVRPFDRVGAIQRLLEIHRAEVEGRAPMKIVFNCIGERVEFKVEKTLTGNVLEE